MPHLDNPGRPLQTNSSDVHRVTPPQRHHLRGNTLPQPFPLTTAGVHASKQHRAPTWSPGQASDVENIHSEARPGHQVFPKGARRPTASNVPKLRADDTTLSLDGTGGSLQSLSLSPSAAVLDVSPSTPDTSTDPGVPSITSLNTSHGQTAASAKPFPGDTQSPLEDADAEAGSILPTSTALSRPNHSYPSSETMHSLNEVTDGKSEMTLGAPIASVTQEPEIPTHPHRRSKWGGSFKSLCQWRRWRSNWKLWCILAMVIAVSLGIPIGFALRVKDISIPNASDAANSSDVLLTATLVKIDPDEKTATFDWSVEQAACFSNPCEDYDIFFNQNFLASDTGKGSNNNISSEPVFSINGTLFNDILLDQPKLPESALQNFPFFTTKISLVGGKNHASKERTLQAYPFDRYGATIIIFARDVSDPNGLALISISSSRGIAVGFTATLGDNVNDGIVFLDIDVARGIVVQIYCIVIVIAIWLVTLTLLSVTISVVFLRREMAKEVTVIPVATLFAFTQLRGTLPGAPPGFGAIVDFIGVLPCLAILALCSVMLLAVFLFYDPENPRVRKDKNDPESKHL